MCTPSASFKLFTVSQVLAQENALTAVRFSTFLNKLDIAGPGPGSLLVSTHMRVSSGTTPTCLLTWTSSGWDRSECLSRLSAFYWQKPLAHTRPGVSLQGPLGGGGKRGSPYLKGVHPGSATTRPEGCQGRHTSWHTSRSLEITTLRCMEEADR